MLVEKVGIPATLEQLAEECNELGHAALKLARHLRNENPVFPKEGMDEAEYIRSLYSNLAEECADVIVTVDEVSGGRGNIISHEAVDSFCMKKIERMKKRLKVNENVKRDAITYSLLCKLYFDDKTLILSKDPDTNLCSCLFVNGDNVLKIKTDLELTTKEHDSMKNYGKGYFEKTIIRGVCAVINDRKKTSDEEYDRICKFIEEMKRSDCPLSTEENNNSEESEISLELLQRLFYDGHLYFITDDHFLNLVCAIRDKSERISYQCRFETNIPNGDFPDDNLVISSANANSMILSKLYLYIQDLKTEIPSLYHNIYDFITKLYF